ncbi:MAG: Txe/YoeB family addiction module toxin [Firmicutes bacterium]|nr:Txe/YoeB family addiction module toxin [Bacillota bacterium]
MKITFTKQALKDMQNIKKNTVLSTNVKKLIEIIKKDPFTNPPHYEKPQGELKGLYSRRINVQHRLVYEVVSNEEIKIYSLWTHYENL